MINQFTQLDLSYRGSPIVIGYPLGDSVGHPGVQAGDRAPDGELTIYPSGERRRLFDLLRGTEHRLLLFVGGVSGDGDTQGLRVAASYVRERYPDRVAVYWIVSGEPDADLRAASEPMLRDDGRQLHDSYGVASAALYLVRPDGHVGFSGAAQHAAELIPYLETILQ